MHVFDYKIIPYQGIDSRDRTRNKQPPSLKRIFDEVGLPLDQLLGQFFLTMDKHKAVKNKRQATKEGKLRRNAKRTVEIKMLYKQDMADQSAGITYEAGIGLKNAKETIKRNEQIRRRKQKDILPALV